MTLPSFDDFLLANGNDAFSIADVYFHHGPPDRVFLDKLRDALPTLGFEHKVAGLMIAGDWAADEFAEVVAPMLMDRDASVWTAAERLFLQVSRLTYSALASIELAAKSCPGDNSEMLTRLRARARAGP